MGVPVKAHQDGVRQRLSHQTRQNPVLRAVRLVHHHDHVLGGVERFHPPIGGRQRLLEFLDGGHHCAPGPGGEQPAQVAGARRLFRRQEAAALEGVADLTVELPAVGDHHDRWIAQARLAAQLGRQPEHRQRLAGALRVPDHAAALLGFAAFQRARQRRAHGAVLLVARQLLDETAALRLVDHIVAQDVQQRGRRQQPNDQLRLPVRLDAKAPPHLVLRVGQHRLPLDVGVLRRAESGVGRRGPAVGDAEQVAVEQGGRAGPVPLGPGLLVAAQLAHGLGLPHIQHGRRLGLHHHQRNAVDEEHQVRLDHALVVLGNRRARCRAARGTAW